MDVDALAQIVRESDDAYNKLLLRPLLDQAQKDPFGVAQSIWHRTKGGMDALQFEEWLKTTTEYQEKHPPEPPPGSHFDPSALSLRDLAKVRGCMWPMRCAVPWGPRPNQPDNILPMDYYEHYGASDRRLMLDTYGGAGKYTHAVTGPVVDPGGYHGYYPTSPNVPTQAEWDAYLDALQEWWDYPTHWIAPIFFCAPDGWSFEQTRDVFEPLLRQERAQRLIRIIVPAGWERGQNYTTSSFTFEKFFAWGRSVLPNALVFHHNWVKEDGSYPDAPVGTDENGDDNGHPNGEGWSRCAPHLHGWLIQSGPYRDLPSANPPQAREWAAQYKPDGDGETYHSVRWHFVNGIAGWPRGSAWGPNEAVWLYDAEQTSYPAFWDNLNYEVSLAWGDFAMRSGADGYLDGGTVDVP